MSSDRQTDSLAKTLHPQGSDAAGDGVADYTCFVLFCFSIGYLRPVDFLPFWHRGVDLVSRGRDLRDAMIAGYGVTAFFLVPFITANLYMIFICKDDTAEVIHETFNNAELGNVGFWCGSFAWASFISALTAFVCCFLASLQLTFASNAQVRGLMRTWVGHCTSLLPFWLTGLAVYTLQVWLCLYFFLVYSFEVACTLSTVVIWSRVLTVAYSAARRLMQTHEGDEEPGTTTDSCITNTDLGNSAKGCSIKFGQLDNGVLVIENASISFYSTDSLLGSADVSQLEEQPSDHDGFQDLIGVGSQGPSENTNSEVPECPHHDPTLFRLPARNSLFFGRMPSLFGDDDEDEKKEDDQADQAPSEETGLLKDEQHQNKKYSSFP
jgi:hypothetical protein